MNRRMIIMNKIFCEEETKVEEYMNSLEFGGTEIKI